MALDPVSTDLLWRSALAVIPLAIVVAIICRWVPCRPSTRHTLWLIVLGFFAAAPFLSQVPVPEFAILSPSPAVTDSAALPLAAIGAVPTPEVTSDRPRALPTLPFNLPHPRTSELPAKTSVEPHRSAAPGNPLIGKSVLPATATKSRMPPIPGAAPAVQRSPSPSPAVTRVDIQRNDEIAASPAASVKSGLSRWAGYAAGIRDSVMGLPPIPAFLWIGGIALLLIVTVLRIGRSVQLVRIAKLAPPSIVNMVASASDQLDLRRAPLTLMTDRTDRPIRRTVTISSDKSGYPKER